jgi:hypothetical protein
MCRMQGKCFGSRNLLLICYRVFSFTLGSEGEGPEGAHAMRNNAVADLWHHAKSMDMTTVHDIVGILCRMQYLHPPRPEATSPTSGNALDVTRVTQAIGLIDFVQACLHAKSPKGMLELSWSRVTSSRVIVLLRMHMELLQQACANPGTLACVPTRVVSAYGSRKTSNGSAAGCTEVKAGTFRSSRQTSPLGTRACRSSEREPLGGRTLCCCRNTG